MGEEPQESLENEAAGLSEDQRNAVQLVWIQLENIARRLIEESKIVAKEAAPELVIQLEQVKTRVLQREKSVRTETEASQVANLSLEVEVALKRLELRFSRRDEDDSNNSGQRQTGVEPPAGGGRIEDVLDRMAHILERPSRPEAPKWPRFTDSHRHYHRFKADMIAYLKDFCRTLDERTKIMHMMENSFTSETCSRISHLRTVDAIFERLDRTYNRPEFFIESLLLPLKKESTIGESDYARLEKFYCSVLGAMQEVRELDLWHHFAHLQNISIITSKFPMKELEHWLSRERSSPSDCPEARMDLLQQFVEERWGLACFMADHKRGIQMTCDDEPCSDSDSVKVSNKGTNESHKRNLDARQSNATAAEAKSRIPCHVEGCPVTTFHTKEKCPTWASLDYNAKWDMVEKFEWCEICLKHRRGADCWLKAKHPDKAVCALCGEKADHHTTLCGKNDESEGEGPEIVGFCAANISKVKEVDDDDKIFGTVEQIESEPKELAPKGSFSANVVAKIPANSAPGSEGRLLPSDPDPPPKLVLLESEKTVIRDVPVTVLYDTGATVSLISPDFAAKQGSRGRPARVNVCGLGQEFPEEKAGRVHELQIQTEEGVSARTFIEMKLPEKVADAEQGLKELAFPGFTGFAAQGGKIDVVFGVDNFDLHPCPVASRGKLKLSRSRFGKKNLLVTGKVEKSAFEKPLSIFEKVEPVESKKVDVDLMEKKVEKKKVEKIVVDKIEIAEKVEKVEKIEIAEKVENVEIFERKNFDPSKEPIFESPGCPTPKEKRAGHRAGIWRGGKSNLALSFLALIFCFGFLTGPGQGKPSAAAASQQFDFGVCQKIFWGGSGTWQSLCVGAAMGHECGTWRSLRVGAATDHNFPTPVFLSAFCCSGTLQVPKCRKFCSQEGLKNFEFRGHWRERRKMCFEFGANAKRSSVSEKLTCFCDSHFDPSVVNLYIGC